MMVGIGRIRRSLLFSSLLRRLILPLSLGLLGSFLGCGSSSNVTESRDAGVTADGGPGSDGTLGGFDTAVMPDAGADTPEDTSVSVGTQATITVLMQVLKNLPGGLPDIHIGSSLPQSPGRRRPTSSTGPHKWLSTIPSPNQESLIRV